MKTTMGSECEHLQVQNFHERLENNLGQLTTNYTN